MVSGAAVVNTAGLLKANVQTLIAVVDERTDGLQLEHRVSPSPAQRPCCHTVCCQVSRLCLLMCIAYFTSLFVLCTSL
jgi:hypothetical protein